MSEFPSVNDISGGSGMDGQWFYRAVPNASAVYDGHFVRLFVFLSALNIGDLCDNVIMS